MYKLCQSAPEFVLGVAFYTYFPAAASERKAEREMLWPEKHPWENSFRGLFTRHKESPANHPAMKFLRPPARKEKRERKEWVVIIAA